MKNDRQREIDDELMSILAQEKVDSPEHVSSILRQSADDLHRLTSRSVVLGPAKAPWYRAISPRRGIALAVPVVAAVAIIAWFVFNTSGPLAEEQYVWTSSYEVEQELSQIYTEAAMDNLVNHLSNEAGASTGWTLTEQNIDHILLESENEKRN